MKCSLRILFLLVFIVGCTPTYEEKRPISSSKESPTIYISNASKGIISNITCNWSGKYNLALPKLVPGESRSATFYLANEDDFFGSVQVSWVNAQRQRREHQFFFRKQHMPSIYTHDTFNYVDIYLDQEGVEIVGSDAPDLTNKIQRMDALLANNHNEYLKNNQDDTLSLIRVNPKKDYEVPKWFSRF